MLSTAHRICDGIPIRGVTNNGRKVLRWHLQDPNIENLLYKSVHANHPCSIWTRESISNYKWHYNLFVALCDEYTHRYGRVHATELKLKTVLKDPPINMRDLGLTPFALAMNSNPECIDHENPIDSYRKFYETKRHKFDMTWTNREQPLWFTNLVTFGSNLMLLGNV